MSPDIILCRKDGLPAEFDGEELGSEAFGYSDDPNQNNWDRDLASSTVTLRNGETVVTTDELLTESGTMHGVLWSQGKAARKGGDEDVGGREQSRGA